MRAVRHVADELHSTRGQDDEIVAHPFDIAEQVRRQHDGELVLGDALHEALKELAARQGIESGDRFVEEEQFGAFGDCQRQRELGSLASRQ